LRGFLREVLTRSTFDYYPVYDPWVVDPWGAVPSTETSENVFDDESEPEQGDVDPDNGTFFALTQLVCLQHLSCQSSVVNADKHLF
jgi:hypothetical protein